MTRWLPLFGPASISFSNLEAQMGSQVAWLAIGLLILIALAAVHLSGASVLVATSKQQGTVPIVFTHREH
jgi:hypothetical protein